MNHTEAEYVNAGAAFERAKDPRPMAYKLRAMLSSERPEDQTYARTLIERGRADGRSR